jgi:hypothetical protein
MIFTDEQIAEFAKTAPDDPQRPHYDILTVIALARELQLFRAIAAAEAAKHAINCDWWDDDDDNCNCGHERRVDEARAAFDALRAGGSDGKGCSARTGKHRTR